MQEEWYEPSERSTLRYLAFLSSLKGQERDERKKEIDQAFAEVYRRIRDEGYQPPPELIPDYEEWLSKHPELYTNPHPQK